MVEVSNMNTDYHAAAGERAQHSPAPWHRADNPRLPFLIYSADGYAVADCKVYHGKHAIEADMRLIENAPRLLAALRAVSHWWQTTPDGDMPADIFDLLTGAIAAAE